MTDAVLHHNWFGAYTFEAQGMRFLDSTFRDNAAYGFDPHDLSNDFLVERNVAHGNGRTGSSSPAAATTCCGTTWPTTTAATGS